MTDRTARIRALNDQFRKTLVGGTMYLTRGVDSLPAVLKTAVIARVMSFDDFTADNDPHGEHDFGSFEIVGNKFFWKIDCYDRNDPDLGSDDPSDSEKTERALTIMLAEEY